MLIFKKFKFWKKQLTSFNFCTNTNKSNNIGLSNSGTQEEAQIGKNMKYKEKFTNKQIKLNREEFLKREITTNPEFFKAFPHLENIIKSENNIEGNLTEHIKENYFVEKGIPQDKYFESLLYKHKGYENSLKNQDEKMTNNVTSFIDGNSELHGAKKYMSAAERDRIHIEIDKRMTELEVCGLSREEILYNKPVGIPLKQDKFFQYLKNNKLAREMLVKPNQAFTVDAVLEIALKQDIGPDPSIAAPRKNHKLSDELPLSYDIK
jgi:hypothetical protein